MTMAMNIFSFLPSITYENCSIFLESYGGLMAQYPNIFPEKIWITEHPEVYTLGHRSSPGDIHHVQMLFPHVPCVKTRRGGEITFHGPNQIMIYPCIALKSRGLSPKDYVASLEIWMEKTLGALGCKTFRHPSYPGLWLKTKNMEKEKKIMSLGLYISKGIALYGLALNVSVDLRYFNSCKLCGLPEELGFTNLQKEGFHFPWERFCEALRNYCPFFSTPLVNDIIETP